MFIGLLLSRVFIGLALAAHGSQKLFGWFGGYGLNGTGGFFEQLGYRPGKMFAAMAGLGEAGGGLLTALGLGGPIGPAIIITVMLVAAYSVHWKNGFWQMKNGYELPALYAAAALSFASAGFGAYSLDAFLGLGGIWSDSIRWIVIAAAVVLGFANLAARRPAPAQQNAA